MIGGGEGALGRLRIAEAGVDQHVVRHLVPHRRGAGRMRRVGVGDEGKLLVFDLDRFRGIERLRPGLGHDHRDRLADMARLVGRERHVRADEDLAAAGAGELHVEFRLRHRRVRNGLEAVGAAVGAGEDAEHARHGARLLGVDAQDAGMRIGRAHHRRIGLPRQAEVVAEPAPAGGEAEVLLAAQRLSDGAAPSQSLPRERGRVGWGHMVGLFMVAIM